MKVKATLLATSCILLLSSNAMALPQWYTVNDTAGEASGGWNNWSNDDSLNLSLANSDEYGTPKVEFLKINYDLDAQKLYKVEVVLDGNSRNAPDALFINTNYTPNSQWDKWSYYITDATAWSGGGYIYSISGFDSPTDYNTSTQAGTRTGNPDGINLANVTYTQNAFNVQYLNSTITYDFGTAGLDLSGGFFVAFAPWCANDVVGGGIAAPIPEPTATMLFALGVAGFAGMARRRMKR